MDDFYVVGELVICGALVIGSTVLATVALCKGERPGRTLKTWLVRLVDAITGLG
jgi:hypothetical protein